MTTTDAGRTAGRIPDLRYQQPEDDLRRLTMRVRAVHEREIVRMDEPGE